MTSYPPAPRPGGAGDWDGDGGGPSSSGPPPSAPTCPRHPDRISYVRCQRCNRPACPECQRQAAVGVQCVDCVREASKQARPTRTVLGGRASGRPIITLTLIGINVAIFLLGFLTRTVDQLLVFAPALGAVEPYRAITTGFLHAGILHLLLNMYALWLIGPFLEQLLGRWRFISLYFLSLFGGTVAVVLFSSPASDSWWGGVVGASGAVFGLFGAVFLVLRRLGRDAQQILLVIGINVVFSFMVRGISWQAHIGGLIIGALLALIFTRLPRERQLVGGIAAVVLVGLALVAGYVGLYAIK